MKVANYHGTNEEEGVQLASYSQIVLRPFGSERSCQHQQTVTTTTTAFTLVHQLEGYSRVSLIAKVPV